MLISHKHKFIFVHVWKTGGNSIRDCLKPYSDQLYPEKKNSFIRFKRKNNQKPLIVDQHITFQELKPIIGATDFNRYFKFAFVRNPLDLIVSYYHFITQNENNHPQKEFIRSLRSFEEYIKWSEEHEMTHLSQEKFIFSENNTMLADYVGRYEEFQKSFDAALKHIKLKNIKLSHLNTSNHNDYLKHYNSTTEGIVRSVLSEDFKAFKY